MPHLEKFWKEFFHTLPGVEGNIGASAPHYSFGSHRWASQSDFWKVTHPGVCLSHDTPGCLPHPWSFSHSSVVGPLQVEGPHSTYAQWLRKVMLCLKLEKIQYFHQHSSGKFRDVWGPFLNTCVRTFNSLTLLTDSLLTNHCHSRLI